MITYEQDPDVVRWGLQLFDGDPYSNCGYYGSVNQNNTNYNAEDYLKNYQCDAPCNDTGNHELHLNDLQEDLSQLSITEPIQEASFLSQDWFPQSLGNYNYGNGNFHEDANDLVISTPCSSPDVESYPSEDWSYSIDENALDDKVGERLNQMVPIPHIPKINGEIPSIDEATLDHQRLLDRLQVYQLVEFKVPGDGNCQFRALSDQFYRTPKHHKFVRRQVVNQLRSHPDMYEGYVPMAYDHYLKKMSKSGEWGDHVTLQAAADSYGVKLFVMTSFKDTCYIEILPTIQKSERVIFLSFWAEVHYNSIYPEGEYPASRTKKKKRWLVDKHES